MIDIERLKKDKVDILSVKRDDELYNITKENKEDLISFINEIEEWIRKNIQEV